MILSRAEASKPEQLESLSSKSGPVKEFLHKKNSYHVHGEEKNNLKFKWNATRDLKLCFYWLTNENEKHQK